MISPKSLSPLLRLASSPLLRYPNGTQAPSATLLRGFFTTSTSWVDALADTLHKKRDSLDENVYGAVKNPDGNQSMLWNSRGGDALHSEKQNPVPNTYTGRSVKVTANLKLSDALKHLDSSLARNKVRHQLKMTERHEKKGVKRRRLSSERWRKQFTNEVRKKVQLVMKIRKRGA